MPLDPYAAYTAPMAAVYRGPFRYETPVGVERTFVPSNLQPILFLVAIAAVFYLLMIRPQQKKRKEMQSMLQALKPGSEIVTTAGMFGRVIALEGDDALLIEVAPGVTCKYMRQSVMRVVPEVTPAAAEPESLPEAKDDEADDAEKDTAATTDADTKAESDDAKAESDGKAEASDDADEPQDAKDVKDVKDSTDESGATEGDRRASS